MPLKDAGVPISDAPRYSHSSDNLDGDDVQAQRLRLNRRVSQSEAEGRIMTSMLVWKKTQKTRTWWCILLNLFLFYRQMRSGLKSMLTMMHLRSSVLLWYNASENTLTDAAISTSIGPRIPVMSTLITTPHDSLLVVLVLLIMHVFYISPSVSYWLPNGFSMVWRVCWFLPWPPIPFCDDCSFLAALHGERGISYLLVSISSQP